MESFEHWFQRLIKLAKEKNFPINTGDPESYRPMFDDGMTIMECLEEEARCAS